MSEINKENLTAEELDKLRIEEEEELKRKKEMEEEQKMREKEEELRKDERMRNFLGKSEEEKDQIKCDEIFTMYLRDICKRVNEGYYKTILRFVLLYRECLNEYGWLKRRDHYMKAGYLESDDLLNKLKI